MPSHADRVNAAVGLHGRRWRSRRRGQSVMVTRAVGPHVYLQGVASGRIYSVLAVTFLERYEPDGRT